MIQLDRAQKVNLPSAATIGGDMSSVKRNGNGQVKIKDKKKLILVSDYCPYPYI